MKNCTGEPCNCRSHDIGITLPLHIAKNADIIGNNTDLKDERVKKLISKYLNRAMGYLTLNVNKSLT